MPAAFKSPVRKPLAFAFAAALAACLGAHQAVAAVSGPSIDDLSLVDSPSKSGDQSANLAQQAQQQDGSLGGSQGGLYQPTKPDAQYVDPDTATRIEKQSSGDYGQIDRASGLSLGTTQDAWDDPYRNMSQGQVTPGVVRFRWSQELTMPVRMREFMDTMIVLPDWEKIKDAYLGEQVYFQLRKIRGNTLALRVKGGGVDTNLNILGESGNLYTFYLRGEGYNTKSITDMSVFVDAAPVNPGMWFKGANGGAGAPAQQQTTDGADWQGGLGQDQSSAQQAVVQPQAQDGSREPEAVSGSNLYIPSLDLKFVHKMYELHPGDRSIAPDYVATDGRWTYFYYGEKGGKVDRPVVTRVVDGVEELVRTRTIGAHNETLVAEAVGEFVLRNGQRTVCVKIDDGSTSQK